MNQLLAFCRPGFESEAGRELTDAAAALGAWGYFTPRPGAGWLSFTLAGGLDAPGLLAQLPLEAMVFVRDWQLLLTEVPLPDKDRVGAVVEALRALGGQVTGECSRVDVRVGENSTDPDLGRFARKWVAPLSRALRGAGLLGDEEESRASDRLELFLLDFTSAFVGISPGNNRARWPMGIPRLKLPASAPSRSALKLEEAWKVLLPADRILDYLGGGKSAVDLGAAPGGWTWQLVQQGMRVTAVDNGPMDDDLMATGMVTHVRADGYLWRPKRSVDWMVCDIVDKPRRTAAMVSDWFNDQLCRYSVFNLKLPMKKRYDEWLLCRELLEARLADAPFGFRLRARQLYHDREEITCFLERTD
ncbi:23S rRNA (cytidine(2498)-2'-O)-methyltransferase RlmM [Marinobacter bryozoorum]|uniref:23S rRNA (cytidine(2498)-2'-O)-methyltransferase RlmM n=1 Tax=Marinobacter bryozoorum TaxID=256324 RepID=UPI002003E1ED|nr:23S rRNA (cytidine(2498)-2'-O)-methyltransferase RlmM [Marinobacter bryozoorum]MCK7544236.1 23S rRNA (cytidine(2498)-2'-O)-methyltransferase RlmM [Marinobacter bryozoorum]